MTKAEAEAANVVVRWAFNQPPPSEPVVLAAALSLLAAGAHKNLGSGVGPEDVSEWSRWGRNA